MPKSRLEINLNGENSGGDSVDQAEPSGEESLEIAELRSQLQFIQELISKKIAQLVEKEQEFGDFAEALTLIKSQSRWMPKPGELQPFDLLRGILEESKNSQERQERLRAAEQALVLSRQVYVEIQNELTRLKQCLSTCEQRLQWELKYGGNLEKYRHSFDWGLSRRENEEVAQEKRDNEIKELEQSIEEKQILLDVAKSIIFNESEAQAKRSFSQSQDDIRWNYPVSTPEHVVDFFPQAIAQLQRNLDRLKSQPLDVELGTPKALLEASFREHVQARSEIEDSLKKLIDAQAAYTRALEEFKIAAQQNPRALEFSARDLPSIPQRVLLDERDTLCVKPPAYRIILEN